MFPHSNGEERGLELQLMNRNPTDVESQIPRKSGAKLSENQPKYNKRGIYFTLLSVLSSIMVVAVWKWNPSLPSAEVITLRSAFATVMTLCLLRKNGEKSVRKLFNTEYIITGIFSSLSIILYFVGSRSLSVSEATTIYATLGIFNGIFGLLFLKEAYPVIERVLGGACFVGVVLIVRPPFLFGEDKQPIELEESLMPRYIAGLVMILSTALWALMQIMMRRVKNQGNTFAVIFQNNFVMTLLCVSFIIIKGDFQTLTFEGYLTSFLLALGNMSITYTIIRALEYEKASVVGLVSYSEIIFAMLVDILIFHSFPSFLTAVGMSIIIASCLFLIKKAA